MQFSRQRKGWLSTSVVGCMSVVLGVGVAAAQIPTPDGEPPSLETVCDSEPKRLFGLCNAYCEAMDCDSSLTHADQAACDAVLATYQVVSGGDSPPCAENLVCNNSEVRPNTAELEALCQLSGGVVDPDFELCGTAVACTHSSPGSSCTTCLGEECIAREPCVITGDPITSFEPCGNDGGCFSLTCEADTGVCFDRGCSGIGNLCFSFCFAASELSCVVP